MVVFLVRPNKSTGRATSQVVVLSRDEEVPRFASDEANSAVFFFNCLTPHVAMARSVSQYRACLGFCVEDIYTPEHTQIVHHRFEIT